MKISAIVLVGSYEPYLEYCLRSISSVVDEIVAVCSTPGEHIHDFIRPLSGLSFKKIMEQVGDDVNFSKWRNQALEACSGEYVIRIDADEVLANPDGSPVSREQLKAAISQMEKEKSDTLSIFTYHFLYNYRTIDGSRNGIHFTKDFLHRRDNYMEWFGKIHEHLQTTSEHKVLQTTNYTGFVLFHFGHCKGMEDLRQKYLRSLSIQENPYRKAFKPKDTIESYIARHELFRGTRPTILYDGPLPEVMRLW